MQQVKIYTDGACSGNPGHGGWAAVLLYRETKKEISGGERDTTNNRMELQAAIEGLKALKVPCHVDLYSDSAYLINSIVCGWLDKWQRNGWMTAKNGPVDNQDLWLEIIGLNKIHQVRWLKVKGHSGNVHNERCDVLARAEVDSLKRR
jgi:ribonuclease HI